MTDFRDKFNGKLSFNFDDNKPSFEEQFGTGNISESRDNGNTTNKGGNNAADIINASANGVNSIGGIISTLMGQPSPNQTQTQAPPPPAARPKVNPLVFAGIGLGVLLLIILLISSSNGKSKPVKQA